MNVLQLLQLERYGKDGLNYLNKSQLLHKYIQGKSLGEEHSAATVRSRLNSFGHFIFTQRANSTSLDKYLQRVFDPYELLQDYATH